MARPNLPSTLLSHLDLTLNRLINFRKNINSKLVSYTATGKDSSSSLNGGNVINGVMIKEILETNPAFKTQMDSEKFFQLAIVKIVDKLIEEFVQRFYAEKELEKEIMLLVERLGKSKSDEESSQSMQVYLKTLAEQERIRVLVMLAMMQALNDQYQFLEVEKQKSVQAYTKEMLHTLDGLQTTDEKPLTENQKTELNKDLSKIEIDLISKYLDKETVKSENNGIRQLIAQIDQVGSKPLNGNGVNGKALSFLPSFNSAKVDQNNYAKIFSKDEFRQEHEKAIKDLVKAKHANIDMDKLTAVTEKRISLAEKDPNLKNLADLNKKKKTIEIVLDNKEVAYGYDFFNFMGGPDLKSVQSRPKK